MYPSFLRARAIEKTENQGPERRFDLYVIENKCKILFEQVD